MAKRIRRNIGIIGLGIIGSRVADNLRRKHFPVFVWNRTPRPVPNFVGSPIELAELCDLIQIFVSDDDAVLEMVQRMKSALTKQHIVIVNSTVSPDTVRAAAEIIERRGGRLVDAPFTGSKAAAANGELVYYVGGEPAAVAEARPVLEASGKEVIEIGAVGQASAMKVATNIITAATVQAAAEALSLTVNAGIAPEKFVDAMRSNGSNSKTLEMKLPKMIEGDFEPHFSVKHMLKDMAIASRVARASGLELVVADAARHVLSAEERAGRGNDDYSAVLRMFFPRGIGANYEPVPERVEDQPTFAGLDRPAEPEAVEIEPAVSTASGDDVPEPVSEPVAAENGATAPEPEAAVVDELPHEEARVIAESLSDVAPVPAAVEAEPAGVGGSLFRRFIRRGADS